MLGQWIADDLMASMGALQANEQRLEISITIVTVLVVLSRMASLVIGPRNGLFATVNIFIFMVFLGCCGFLVADQHRLAQMADAVVERIPSLSH